VELVARQSQAAEGADVHTEVAPGAVVFVDHRLRPIGPLGETRLDHTVLIFDALHRAYVGASPAIDANIGIDFVNELAFSGDGINGAHLDTGRATDTSLGNDV